MGVLKINLLIGDLAISLWKADAEHAGLNWACLRGFAKTVEVVRV